MGGRLYAKESNLHTEEYGKMNADTQFTPGNQAAKGRGPNKVSTKVKEAIVKFLEDNVDKIQESFDELKAGEKLKFIADILPYAAPKMQSVQNDLNASGEIKVTVTWDKEIPPSIPTP